MRDAVTLVAQLLSTLVAVTALVIGFRSERRNQKRFDRQMDLTTKIAKANIKPLLAISIDAYINEQGVELINHGAGTAVIKKLQFSRKNRHSQDMSVLINLDAKKEIVWDESPSFDDKPFYLPSKSSEDLLRLTSDGLIEDGFSENEALKLLETLEPQIDEIKVVVTYEDVLGNKIVENERLV
jgi:hypothetical protein